MASRKIMATNNYSLFIAHDEDNRPTDAKKHRKLMESMKLYGFLAEFPIVVYESGGKLVIKDGQHRFMFAQQLGLSIFYVIADTDFDIAIVNSAAKPWQLRDYAEKHAANGISSYREGLDFADQYGLPIGTSFALLAGTTAFSNCQKQFIDGEYKVKDRDWANSVAAVYGPICMLSKSVRNARFIEACMGACRVKSFDPKRMVKNAERCRDKLASYSTKDAYLDMMETVYNFGRKDLLGLKSAAIMAMRERNPSDNGKKKKTEDAA